ncbi:hypothetical protein [Flavobacterium maritimum]|uniref:hypothetical protein n=1 Tax=Flavobacterium maritimum TaxID=3149042 RepID=UPI0032B4F609
MKNLIVALVLVLGMTSFAQDKKERPSRQEMEKFTPEQKNQLMLKKMTLELDLNAKQQEQVKQVIAEQSAKREAIKAEQKAKQDKPTSDERFAMKNKMLDEQIAMKAKMKTILTAEQLEKWDAMKENHHQRGGHRGHEGGCEMKK